jgi:hypothetical protein
VAHPVSVIAVIRSESLADLLQPILNATSDAAVLHIDFPLVASPRDGPMLVRLRGPNDHVSIVWKVVVKRLALADQFFTRRRSMNVIDQLVLSLIEFVRAKGRFVAVVNELIGERRLRVHELDGSVAVRCVNQHPGWLSRFRMFSIWASGFDVDEIPSPNNTWLL